MILGGGLFDSNSKINRNAYILDLASLKGRKLQKMINRRYNFNLVCWQKKVYALGGRSYGVDSQAIMSSCEVFDPELMEWKSIADMNVQRCNFSALVVQNSLWVVGGYCDTNLRSQTIEKYDWFINKWEMLGLQMIYPIEGFSAFYSQPVSLLLIFLQLNSIYIMGGVHNYPHS